MSGRTATSWLYAITAMWAGMILLISVSATMGWGLEWFARVRAIPGGDKVAHFLLIGGMSLLGNLSLRAAQVQLPWGRVLLGSLVLYVLVTIEEFTQLAAANRTFDLLDLASNYLGIYLFGWLAEWWNGRQNQ